MDNWFNFKLIISTGSESFPIHPSVMMIHHHLHKDSILWGITPTDDDGGDDNDDDVDDDGGDYDDGGCSQFPFEGSHQISRDSTPGIKDGFFRFPPTLVFAKLVTFVKIF